MAYVDYVDTLVTGITPVGMGPKLPAYAQHGDYWLDTSTNLGYVFIDQDWVRMASSAVENNKQETSPLLKDGICQCCGAPDTGKMRCSRCQTVLRW